MPEACIAAAGGLVIGSTGVGLYFKLGDFNPHLFLKVLVGLLPGVVAGGLLISRGWFVRGIAAVAGYVGLRLLLG
jgi:ABC-type transport system involved in cytochrome bd biosynthesis fused ATPase/permease subunit